MHLSDDFVLVGDDFAIIQGIPFGGRVDARTAIGRVSPSAPLTVIGIITYVVMSVDSNTCIVDTVCFVNKCIITFIFTPSEEGTSFISFAFHRMTVMEGTIKTTVRNLDDVLFGMSNESTTEISYFFFVIVGVHVDRTPHSLESDVAISIVFSTTAYDTSGVFAAMNVTPDV